MLDLDIEKTVEQLPVDDFVHILQVNRGPKIDAVRILAPGHAKHQSGKMKM